MERRVSPKPPLAQPLEPPAPHALAHIQSSGRDARSLTRTTLWADPSGARLGFTGLDKSSIFRALSYTMTAVAAGDSTLSRLL